MSELSSLPSHSPENSAPFTTGRIPAHENQVRTPDQMLENLEQVDQLVNDLLDEPTGYQIDAPACQIPADFMLSIVVPVYNEEATIKRVIGRILEIPVAKEIIVIDDCSTDGTRELLNEIAKRPEVSIHLKDENAGKGAALRTGFEAAKGDVIIVQDADLEYDPRDIPQLLVPILQNEADVVYGSRFIGDEVQDESWVHRMGNGFLTGFSNLTTGLKLTDMETCYKAFRAPLLKEVDVEQNRFGFEPEITAKLARRKARFAEAPIGYNARTYAEGKKIGVKDLINALYCIVKYGWFSRS